jgi:hypothetical protein
MANRVHDGTEPCPQCLTAPGKLCARCERGVLPQLAVNVGWLKLMGESRTEQVSRQRKITASLPISDAQAAHLVRKRLARKPRRGVRALLAAIAA